MLPLRLLKGLLIVLQYHHAAAEGRLERRPNERAKPEAPRRRGLSSPRSFCSRAVGVLVALGTWQLERRSWKEALIAELDTKLVRAARSTLPARERWPQLNAATG